jgi:hypothetical protein
METLSKLSEQLDRYLGTLNVRMVSSAPAYAGRQPTQGFHSKKLRWPTIPSCTKSINQRSLIAVGTSTGSRTTQDGRFLRWRGSVSRPLVCVLHKKSLVEAAAVA